MAHSASTTPATPTTLSAIQPTTAASLSTPSGSNSFTIGAILTEAGAHTTVTAIEVPGTTGLAVVDGTTLSWRHQGITLANGVVVSVGFNGLEDKTTTAAYSIITVGATNAGSVSGSTSTSSLSSSQAVTTTTTSGSASLKTLQGTRTQSGSTSGSSASASSSATSAAAPSLGAGKTVALLGALGGLIAYGF